MRFGKAIGDFGKCCRKKPGETAIRSLEIILGAAETASIEFSPGGVFMLVDGTTALGRIAHDGTKPDKKAHKVKKRIAH